MYNGIGLKTARGTGTNGYIQRNLSNVRPRDNPFTKPASSSAPDVRHTQPDAAILEHERKRRVEVRCMELRIQLEDDDVPDDEIELQVQALREKLTAQLEQQREEEAVSKVDAARLRVGDTHRLAEAKQHDERRFARAVGVESGYREGDAFDRELQERKKQERIEERRRRDEERRESGRGGRSSRLRRGGSAKGRTRRGMLDGLDTVRGRKRCRVRPRLAQGSAASTAKVRDPSPTRASDPRDAEMTAGERGERCNVDVREVDPLPDRASPPAPGRGRGRGQGRATILVRARDQGRGRDHALYHVRVCVCVRARVRAQLVSIAQRRSSSLLLALTLSLRLLPQPQPQPQWQSQSQCYSRTRASTPRHPHAPQAFEPHDSDSASIRCYYLVI